MLVRLQKKSEASFYDLFYFSFFFNNVLSTNRHAPEWLEQVAFNETIFHVSRGFRCLRQMNFQTNGQNGRQVDIEITVIYRESVYTSSTGFARRMIHSNAYSRIFFLCVSSLACREGYATSESLTFFRTI